MCRRTRIHLFLSASIAFFGLVSGYSGAETAVVLADGGADVRSGEGVSIVDAATMDSAADAAAPIEASVASDAQESGPTVGATTPFLSYEAESGALGGGATVVALTAPPLEEFSSPVLEASGHAYVQLVATPRSVEWVNNTGHDVTAIDVRACIPDAPTGGGITATLDLYVNGMLRQSLALNSKQTWGTKATDTTTATTRKILPMEIRAPSSTTSAPSSPVQPSRRGIRFDCRKTSTTALLSTPSTSSISKHHHRRRRSQQAHITRPQRHRHRTTGLSGSHRLGIDHGQHDDRVGSGGGAVREQLE